MVRAVAVRAVAVTVAADSAVVLEVVMAAMAVEETRGVPDRQLRWHPGVTSVRNSYPTHANQL